MYACLQRLQLTNSPQVWAVVETDSVSWFHSLKSSAVSPVQASKVGQAEQQNTLTQDALAHTDRRWLQATFSCLYLELSVELLLYGLESVTSTSADVATAPTVSLEAAAGAAVSAVIDSTCGSTAAFLATTDQTGMHDNQVVHTQQPAVRQLTASIASCPMPDTEPQL